MTTLELNVIDDDNYKDRYIYDIKDNNISTGTIVINKNHSTKDIQRIFDDIILNIKKQKGEIKMNEQEQEKAVRLINRHYLESLILREMKICLVKEGYRVGIYTLTSSQNEHILKIIKDVYNDKLFGQPFSASISNENNIIIDFNNRSTIRILDYHNKERGNKFNDVLINRLIPRKDINEMIERPKALTTQKPIRDRIFYYEM